MSPAEKVAFVQGCLRHWGCSVYFFLPFFFLLILEVYIEPPDYCHLLSLLMTKNSFPHFLCLYSIMAKFGIFIKAQMFLCKTAPVFTIKSGGNWANKFVFTQEETVLPRVLMRK